MLYPGVGTFVLIRPAQTFYERIMIVRGGGQSAGGTFLESVALPRPTTIAGEGLWGPHSPPPQPYLENPSPPTIHAGPPGEVGIGTQGCRGATTCRPARPFAVVSESTAHEYWVLASF